ncbi:MAG: hypothetical protein Ta2D_08040 [Rickettsiales bacterium]|nr:MAG: hypothetical protein Ta2D_08040 [Rickettsiales bacterium]
MNNIIKEKLQEQQADYDNEITRLKTELKDTGKYTDEQIDTTIKNIDIRLDTFINKHNKNAKTADDIITKAQLLKDNKLSFLMNKDITAEELLKNREQGGEQVAQTQGNNIVLNEVNKLKGQAFTTKDNNTINISNDENINEHLVNGNDVAQRTPPILKIREDILNDLQKNLSKAKFLKSVNLLDEYNKLVAKQNKTQKDYDEMSKLEKKMDKGITDYEYYIAKNYYDKNTKQIYNLKYVVEAKKIATDNDSNNILDKELNPPSSEAALLNNDNINKNKSQEKNEKYLYDINIMDKQNKILHQGGKQTNTPQFKKWFGDSKVVDKKGKPLVVYHGSGGENDIKIFDSNKTSEFNAKGIYFTDNENVATQYSDIKGGSNYDVFLLKCRP